MRQFLVIAFTAISLIASAQLTENSTISLLTCDAGDEVYERFGHSALRVCDTTQQLDVVFHYGVFDFDTEWFIPKFVKGATDYEIGMAPTSYFVESYAKRQSSVIEQVINLNLAQRQALFDALIENYQPENRQYRYNFVFDNCATRPYHMILNAFDSGMVLCDINTTKTYREIIHECIGWHNWSSFGIALVLGCEADQTAGNEGAVGFPFYLRNEFNHCWVQIANDTIEPLVLSERLLCSYPSREVEHTSFFAGPFFISCLLLLIGIVLLIFNLKGKAQKLAVVFDTTLYAIVGILGCIIFYLMCFSLHPLVHTNWNMIWANPLWLIAAVLTPLHICDKIRRHFAISISILMIVAIFCLVATPQAIHVANLPIIALLIVRQTNYIVNPNKLAKINELFRSKKH